MNVYLDRFLGNICEGAGFLLGVLLMISIIFSVVCVCGMIRETLYLKIRNDLRRKSFEKNEK